MFEARVQDIRYAIRTLLRAPAFLFAAVASLALGFGANAAVFSVVDAVLLRDPPFPHAERLALILRNDSRLQGDLKPLSYLNYKDIRDNTRAFENVGAWSSFGELKLTMTGCTGGRVCGLPAEQVRYSLGSSSLFAVLGVKPVIGRVYDESADVPGAGDRVLMISDALWRRRLNADPNAIGSGIVLDGVTYRITGVLPPDFEFGAPGDPADLWIPLGVDPNGGNGNRSRMYARGVSYLGVIARERAGVAATEVANDVARVEAILRAADPERNGDSSLRAAPLRDQLVQQRRATLITLFGAVALVLLICCVNVANLLIARASGRSRETAVRLSLGATRGRLIAQHVTESCVLALIGAVAGLLVARWSLDLLSFVDLSPESPWVPYRVRADAVGIDARVFGFTAAVAVASGILFGLLPGFQSAKTSIESLRAGANNAGLSATRLREVLVVAEVALAVSLLVGAVLLTRTLLHLTHANTGFEAEHAIAAEISLPRSQYDSPERIQQFYQALVTNAAAQPDVAAAGAAEQLPLTGPVQSTDFRLSDRAFDTGEGEPLTQYMSVTPGYFASMSVRLVRGRDIAWSDDRNSARVAIVNESFAKRFWPGENPIGKRVGLSLEALRFRPDGPPTIDFEQAYRTVIGVSADVKQDAIAAPTTPAVFVPFSQSPRRDMTIVVRSARAGAAVAPMIRREIANIDADLPAPRLRAVSDDLDRSVGQERFRALLIGIFALIAALLAAIGVYGVMAFAVAQRTREIGVRVALGAAASDVTRLLAMRGVRLALIGTMIGGVTSAALAGLIQRFLFGVRAHDLTTFAMVAVSSIAIAALASWIPAHRASRIDPMTALRSD